MDAEQKKRCSELLETLMRLDSAEPFLERVNWEEWGLYDYLQIVKTPMDLGTIRSKLNKGAYKTSSEFVKDVRLVWDNCKLYNQEGSDLYDVAVKLSKRFEDRVRTLKLDVNPAPRAAVTIAPDANAIPAPSFEERIRFGQHLYSVLSKDLSEIVAVLEDKCPKALDKTSPDELDIVIDAIDPKTFRELDKLVRERIPQGSHAPAAKRAQASGTTSSDSAASAAKKSKTVE